MPQQIVDSELLAKQMLAMSQIMLTVGVSLTFTWPLVNPETELIFTDENQKVYELLGPQESWPETVANITTPNGFVFTTIYLPHLNKMIVYYAGNKEELNDRHT